MTEHFYGKYSPALARHRDYLGHPLCARLDDDICSGWFSVEYGLRQECAFAPLLFNIVLTAVIQVALVYFEVD